MIKLIASDMDGTLLNDKMEVSDENAQAIREAQAAGIEFMVATGRGVTEAKPLLAAQNLKPAFITLNGAMVFDEAGKLVVTIPIADDLNDYIVKTLQKDNIYFEVVTNKGVFSDSRVERIQNVADLLVDLNPDTTYKLAVALAAARLELMNINYVDDYQELLDDPTIQIMKFIAFTGERHDILKVPAKTFEATGKLSVTSSSANNIEVNNIKAQKGYAVEAYAKQRGITMDEVMTIGDNLNDASMIKMAKYGVAMGNAIPEITALAWDTTKTNSENGVAAAIRKAIRVNKAETSNAHF
ncbi:Cof-type HAD-IIB family hydrolase [Lacticaseibacillus rhamnosus]|uniref:Cof-type HAD-IIB family hydrolase n=1 Tax=Lacticaseibacillus rhamnosus TaxID=47715 RepID=UPI00065A9516|nr:Cof-type HAD-IIB family hydrolase [Lacticaseibacillus rhamnosus]KMO46578.1 HAD family hydrolase [Lacticaseibacillus rhamnosus]OAU00666.1 HAD family hydrolase [Lacticaseibacillus rhamnosus]